MNVQELITILKTQDPHQPVIMSNDYEGNSLAILHEVDTKDGVTLYPSHDPLGE